MSSLADLYLKIDVLETILNTLKKKGDKGIVLTISISDTANKYGQNVSAHVSQSKEQREAKKDKFYVGNGKVLWTDGKIVKAEKQEPAQASAKVEDFEDLGDLPF